MTVQYPERASTWKDVESVAKSIGVPGNRRTRSERRRVLDFAWLGVLGDNEEKDQL